MTKIFLEVFEFKADGVKHISKITILEKNHML